MDLQRLQTSHLKIYTWNNQIKQKSIIC